MIKIFSLDRLIANLHHQLSGCLTRWEVAVIFRFLWDDGYPDMGTDEPRVSGRLSQYSATGKALSKEVSLRQN